MTTAVAGIGAYPKLSAAFADAPARMPTVLLVKHGRIAHTIDDLWGTREAVRYLDTLMFSDRDDREGFTETVLAELVLLKQLHEARYPQLSCDPNDAFAAAAAQQVREERMPAAIPPARTAPAVRAEPPPLPAGPAAMLSTGQAGLAAPLGTLMAPANPFAEIKDIEELRAVVSARKDGKALPGKDGRRLGRILVAAGLADEKAIEAALKLQKHQGGRREPMGRILQQMGVIGEDNLIRALCRQAGILQVDLNAFRIDGATMKRVPIDAARTRGAVPLAVLEGQLFLAVDNPLAFGDREFFAFLTNLNVELVLASRQALTQRLSDYGQPRSAREIDEEFRSLAKKAFLQMPVGQVNAEVPAQIAQDDATVVGLVNRMINDAASQLASDIHLESYPNAGYTRIRFRRDGWMQDYSEFPSMFHEAVVSRIKIMADLDIAEKRKAQDGKIYFPRPGHGRLDLRVAVIPTLRGIENVTIRLLPAGEPMAIDAIGMSGRDLTVFRRLIAKPYGLILVCGPTGSGKTTSLHSALKELNTTERKIWTAEDPVEIVQANICQVQVNAKIGWGFANALRAFLRADPDVIMIGEMRDEETARIAIEASMTGHLVMSTLHTNSASETAARLLDLGVDPYNLADAILGIFAQRLARKLCPACVQRQPMPTAEAEELASEYYYAGYQRQPAFNEREAIIARWREQFGKEGQLMKWHARGCADCGGSGYKGRIGLYEMLEVTPAIRRLIRTQAAASEFQQTAIGEGMSVLKQDGIEKTLRGLTDVTQVRSACI